MFEAFFTLSALVESGEQGQHIFKAFEHQEPFSEEGFSSVLETIYHQNVYPTLQPGDLLMITMHHDLADREIEKAARFREDHLFEGDGIATPIPDLLPFITEMYQQFIRRVLPGSILTVSYRVQRV